MLKYYLFNLIIKMVLTDINICQCYFKTLSIIEKTIININILLFLL